MESAYSPTQTISSLEADQYEQYRTLSFSAIVALVFGLISVPTALVAPQNVGLLVFPLIGMLIGVFAVFKLQNRTDEFTGMGAAKFGLLLSTILFFGGFAFTAYTYATEVPEGYERISFGDLQPDPRRPELPYAPLAEQLIERKVFVKGYVYPDGQRTAIKQFVLVPDMGTCCFGGQPKLTDMIQVTLEDPHRVEYTYYRRSLAGTFRMGSSTADKVGQIIYHLEADYVR